MQSARFSIRLAVGLLGLLATGWAVADEPAGDRNRAVIHLINGDFASGSLVDCSDPKLLRWQCSAATAPFDFLCSAVSAIHFPHPKEAAPIAADYCVELAGGDTLFGSLVSLNASELILDVPGQGQLHIARERLARIQQWKHGGELVYLGPNGIAGWEFSDASVWNGEAGELVANRPGVSAYNKLELPARAAIELDLSWKGKADFVAAFGADGIDEKSLRRSFRVEGWLPQVMAVREADRSADLAEIAPLKPGPGRLSLRIYIDQPEGRMFVFSESGKLLAELKCKDSTPRISGGVRLLNQQGDVRLERLRISSWNGRAPQDLSIAKAHVNKLDGSTIDGEINEFDAARKQFVVRTESSEVRLDANQIDSAVFAPSGQPESRGVRVLTHHGVRVSGELESVVAGCLKINSPGIKEPLRLTDVQSLVMLAQSVNSPPAMTGHPGRLELEGVRLRGNLIDSPAESEPDASGLVWQPIGSKTGAPLRSGVAGKIIYRDSASAQQVANPQTPNEVRDVRRVLVAQQQFAQLAPQLVQMDAAQRAVVIARLNAGANPGELEQAAQMNQPPPTTPSLQLRAGDVIPGRVTGINAEGVSFQSTVTDARLVPHDAMKAVELLPQKAGRPLDQIRRERLLTIPRMQKNNPPTHLVVSINGDYLRGRLTEMDDKALTIEVQLESRRLPRDQVARIIWLHPDELADAKEPKPDAAASPFRVQALRRDGERMTFKPERMTAAELAGTSDVVGPCHVNLSKLDQLLLGREIDANSANSPYGMWKLHHAVEPQFASDTGEGQEGRANGLQSPLVGKPAPDFQLKLLDGTAFHLSDHKGKTVVLDFWATWCGPCVQAMPVLEQTVADFKDQGVELIAVNMQEDAKTIGRFLERTELQPTVALDTDGVAAQKYAVSAIPQTVIIDASGKVTRLFIGGGPAFGDQVRDALKETLSKVDAPGSVE
jgi:thiol-disulfide isomerase/thioredoxin